jgi:asparagine synthetase B (glutamine-hydrolysing)
VPELSAEAVLGAKSLCGIAGMCNLDGVPVAPESLERMIRMLAHRGPDDTGFYAQDGAGLAHARLSIIDLASRPPAHVQRGLRARGHL